MKKKNLAKGFAFVSVAVGIATLGLKKLKGFIDTIQEEMPDLPAADSVYRDKMKPFSFRSEEHTSELQSH